MQQSSFSSFVLPDAVRVISNSNQHILVHTDHLAWVKIDKPLFQIVSTLNTLECELIKTKIKNEYGIKEEDITNSLEFLTTRGILEKKEYGNNQIQHQYLESSNNLDELTPINTIQKPSVLLDVTNRCNLKCPYCYAGSSQNCAPTSSDPTITRLTQIAKSLLPVQPISITLSGGEPTLRNDIAEIITNFCDITSSPIFMNTNGTLLNSSLCNKIAPLLSGVSLSLDGSTSELHDFITGVQGTFDKVINGIKNLQNAGLQCITITSTICRQNLNDLPNMIEIAKSLGVRFSTSFMVPTGCASINSETFLISGKEESELEERCWRKCLELDFPEYPQHPFYREHVRFARMRCPAFNSLYILTDGSIYPCPALRSREDYYIGNALEYDNLVDLIKTSTIMTNLTSLHVDKNPHDTKCSGCDVRYFCGGGCLGLELNTEGCSWKKKRLRNRIWNYQDGRSLSENITAMFGIQYIQEQAE